MHIVNTWKQNDFGFIGRWR